MTPKYTPVQPVRISATCNCGGEYRQTGQNNLTDNTFGHRCDRCSMEIQSKTKFPAIEHFTEEELKHLFKP